MLLVLALLLVACGSDRDPYLEAFPVEEYERVDVPGVGAFYLDQNPGYVKKNLRKGKPWAPHVLIWMREHVVPGSTVLDVGAHIGSITIPMARLVGPEGRVFAFEPQRKIHRELFHNLKLNDLQNVSALRLAVGAGPGMVELDPVDRMDGMVGVGAAGEEVEMRTIDSFGFTDVSFIKIDVEGFEVEVLKGAQETLRTSRPALVVEILNKESKQLLRDSGYVFPVNHGSDYLAVPKEKRRSAARSLGEP